MKKSLAFAALVMAVVSACLFGGCVKAVVYFNPDGGNIVAGDSTALYDGKIEITAPDVSRDGYLFRGWNGEFGNPQEDITVNAMWDKLYTVTFDPVAEEETDMASAQTLTSSDTVVYPADPTREGYVFDGWDSDVVNVSEDTIITGKWKKLYNVRFNLNGGTTEEKELLSQTIVEGEAAKAPAVEIKYMKPVKWDKDFSEIHENLYVSAIWERRDLTSTEIAELISPATVEVSTYRWNNAPWSTGTGFFIDNSGSLVTNYHVIKDSYAIKVKFADGSYAMVTNVISFDEKLDLAILKVNKSGTNCLELMTTTPEKGEVVYAIGSSLGLEGTFSSGLVSTVSREFEGQTYIQTSASVSHGNSGGPLVNSKGFVIGVNTLTIADGQNLNFAVPAAKIKQLKTNSMSVNTWSGKYNDIKYWMFEKMVSEDAETKLSGTTDEFHLQGIGNGETVKGRYSYFNDWDFYYISSYNRRSDSSGKKLTYDLYAYFYSESSQFLDDCVLSFLEKPIFLQLKDGYFLYTKALQYNEISIIPYGKYFIYRLKLENYTSYSLDVGIFISSNKYNFADYQLFLVALPAGSDTSMIDSAVFGNEKTSIRNSQADIKFGVASGNKFVIISTVY